MSLVRLCKTKVLWKAKFGYMDTHSFIVYIKSDNTSDYRLDKALPKGKIKK